jgi:outer membrane protein
MSLENTNQDEVGPMQSPKNQKVKRQISFSSLINILLFCGLIVLYALYFFKLDRTGDQQEELIEMKEKVDEASSSIAYVNSEFLLEEYELAVKMRADFEREQARLEDDLSRRQRTFQSDVEVFQRGLNAGTISIDRAEVREQELMQVQQELMQLSDTYRERLGRKEFDMNVELLEKISDFLERYNREKGYDFILGYTRGGGILYADTQHDITQDVLTRLNNEFRAAQ